jgi:hypothetical protein
VPTYLHCGTRAPRSRQHRQRSGRRRRRLPRPRLEGLRPVAPSLIEHVELHRGSDPRCNARSEAVRSWRGCGRAGQGSRARRTG